MMIKNVLVRSPLFHYYKAYKYYKRQDIRADVYQNSELNKKRKMVGICTNGSVRQFEKLLKKISITIRNGQRFQNWIDTGIFYCRKNVLIQNTSPDYRKVIDYSLKELKMENTDESNAICMQNRQVLLAVEQYIVRIMSEIRSKTGTAECASEKKRLEQTYIYFKRMYNEKAESLEEALQRILFWSDMFWQTGHMLMGLGRLDMILDRFEISDRENTIKIIQDFYDSLHRYYPFKSGDEALGDTGQIIILGGEAEDGSYFYNEYTYLFIEALKKHKIPDPKLLLRVSDKMPDELLACALKCIATGVGSPLLANDKIIIPSMTEFGYQKEDACNYVVSACWEPFVYGKSAEVNNIRSINYAKAITGMYQSTLFLKCRNYEDILKLYFENLDIVLEEMLLSLDRLEWERDPLLTFFTDGCIENGKDVSEGGAVYTNYGVLGDGFGNTVNSLLFIKDSVYRDGIYTLEKIREICISDYVKEEERKKIARLSNYYGKDEEEVWQTVKRIKEHVFNKCGFYRNKFGGRLKWGVSSSNYMINGKNTAATLDGRRAGEPLNVHISGSGPLPYTELINFASGIEYSNHGFNGNVVDFIVSQNFIDSNFEKFLNFLKLSILNGFFEMQMNVVNSGQLIEAKRNPKEHLDLIVRVWGFSAYFVELPEEYQNLLIKRALISEEKDVG